jgi:Ca-activated chloride channel homolog
MKQKKLFNTPFLILLLMAIGLLGIWGFKLVKDGAQKTSFSNKSQLIIVLDISKSMLAKDVNPSRINKAIACIKELVVSNNFSKIGIVNFSRTAVVEMPLTPDFGIIENTVKRLSDKLIENTSNANAALYLANLQFNTYEPDNKNILIITDGELHDNINDNTILYLNNNNIKLFANLIGTKEGAQIVDPTNNDFVKDPQGNMVTTKVDEEKMQQAVQATNGKIYFNNTGAEIAKMIVKENKQEKKQPIAIPWFGILALLILLAEVFIKILKPTKIKALPIIVLFGLFAQNVNAQLTQEQFTNEVVRNIETNQLSKALTLIDNNKLMQDNKILFYKAYILQQDQKYTDAISLLQPLKFEDEQFAIAAKYNTAAAHFALKNWEETIALCKNILSTNPNQQDAQYLLQKSILLRNEQQKQQRNGNEKNNKNSNQWNKLLRKLEEDDETLKRKNRVSKDQTGVRNW